MTFKELNITEPLLTAIEEKGYAVPTPIQGEAIPVSYTHLDVYKRQVIFVLFSLPV